MKKTGKFELMSLMCPGCAKALRIKIEEYLVPGRGAAEVSKFDAPSTFLCGCNTLLHLDFFETLGGDRQLIVRRTEVVTPSERLLLWEQGNPVTFSAWWIVDGNLIDASEAEVNAVGRRLERAGSPSDFGLSTKYSATVYKVKG